MTKTKKIQNIGPADSKSLKKIGIFDLKDAKKLGFSQSGISRLSRSGDLEKVGHGYYLHLESKVSREHLDFILICKRMGDQCVITGLTALFYYGLIRQVPNQIWIVVPKSKQLRSTYYRIIRTENVKSKVGVVQESDFRMASLERALIESLKYSTKVGPNLAIEATVRAIRDRRTTFKKLVETAKALGMTKTLEKYSDVILAAQETA